MKWSAPTDLDSVCKRAAGRRRYNAKRQAEARDRFKIVLEAILPPEGRKRGTQAQLARDLGVHPATICRDVKKWKRTLIEVMMRLKVLHGSEASDEVSDNR